MNQCVFIAKLKRIIVLVTICDYKTISFRQYHLSTCIIQGHWRYYWTNLIFGIFYQLRQSRIIYTFQKWISLRQLYLGTWKYYCKFHSN